jgi:choline dehydrogenase-like flavoprotein
MSTYRASRRLEVAIESGSPIDRKKQLISALGALFVPSRASDPGYADLESYGITEYALEDFRVTDAAVDAFNAGAQPLFDGKAFLDLDGKRREEYLNLIIDGRKIADAEQRKSLQGFYQTARRRILFVYYSNYPEHKVKRDLQGLPVVASGDTHQQLNPNSNRIVTGWDIAGYSGPPRWEEEEAIRASAKKKVARWFEGDTVSLKSTRPPAAQSVKTSDGHDYYDVIVVGAGVGGCVVAARLVERGINPKTGDRLRVALLEGGDDWTIKDPGIKPGYGYPIRRRMITNIEDGIGPEGGAGPQYRYPDRDRGGPAGYNYRIVGGCSIHWGGTLWIPQEEDFNFYRQASGVDWDLAKFGDAIQEVRDVMGVMNPPDAWWTRGDHLWADAGRVLGYQMRVPELAYRNPLGFEGGGCNRYDTKGTALPWAYIGLNNGLNVIANAEAEKVLIEKSPNGRPVATGVVYRDKSGAMHELRAARVIVACATNWTPLLLYKSGYGPRELLGDKLLIENKNVGQHMTGDFSMRATAFLPESMSPTGRDGEMFGPEPWVAVQPRPWPEMSVQIRADSPDRDPKGVALGPFAPPFGWDHKEYMRNADGASHILSWASHLGAIRWSWRVLPGRGETERVYTDMPLLQASIRDTEEIVRSWMGKLALKPVKTDLSIFSRPAESFDPRHVSGTARAGVSRDTSVCTSDFDCHDIDHLLFTSAATIPRTFFWSMGPTAVNACYAWRRMLANHFSRGCSTRGFA